MKKGMTIVDINRFKNTIYGRGYYAGRKRLANPLADRFYECISSPRIPVSHRGGEFDESMPG